RRRDLRTFCAGAARSSWRRGLQRARLAARSILYSRTPRTPPLRWPSLRDSTLPIPDTTTRGRTWWRGPGTVADRRHVSDTTGGSEEVRAGLSETGYDGPWPASLLVRGRSFCCGGCWVRTNVGCADGFTDRSLWPLGQPASPRGHVLDGGWKDSK